LRADATRQTVLSHSSSPLAQYYYVRISRAKHEEQQSILLAAMDLTSPPNVLPSSVPSLGQYDTLEELISHELTRKGRPVASVQVGEDIQRGLGGGGASGSLKATATMADGQVLHLFVKKCRQDSQEAEWNAKLGIFHKECAFFEEILPRLLAHAPGHAAVRFLPKFVAAGNVNHEAHIVFEDFSHGTGLAPPAKEEYLQAEDVVKCMHAIGVFHSLSRTSYNWPRVLASSDFLRDRMCAEENEEALKPLFCYLAERNLAILTKLVRMKLAGGAASMAFKVPESITLTNLDRLRGLCENFITAMRACRLATDAPVDVLTHGDFHMWNVALAADRKDIMMFDFQVVNHGPFACDLHQFLSQTVKSSVRRERIRDFLLAYRLAFLSNCNDEETKRVWTEENVTKEYSDRSPVGLAYGLSFILRRFVSGSDETLKRAAASDKDEEAAQILLEAGGEGVWEVVNDLLILLDEYISYGVIEKIDRALKNK